MMASIPSPEQTPKPPSPRRFPWPLLVFIVLFGLVTVIPERYNTYQAEQALQNLQADPVSFTQALSRAEATNRQLLIEVSADWCGYCAQFHAQVLTDSQVQAFLKNQLQFARLDYDDPANQDFIRRYKIRGVPSLLLFRVDGRLQKQLPVVYEPQPFLQSLQQSLAPVPDLP